MSIRKKLTILMLLIGVLPTLVVSVIAYYTLSASLTRKTAEQLISTAIKQEQKINGQLQNKQEEAVELTNKYDLQAALGQYFATAGRNGYEELNTILLTKKLATPDIQNIYIADLQGKVLATTIRDGQGKQLAPADYAMAAGRQTTTRVREDPRDGINKLFVTAKISVNKKEAAYMSVIFRIDDIVAAAQDYTGLGSTGETLVAEKDASGNAISLLPLRFDADAALKTQLNSLQLFSSFNGSYKEFTDYRGHKVMVAARAVGFADWSIATKIDRDEALAQIGQLRNTLLVIVAMSSIVIMLIALYFSRFFTKPILRIAEAAERIGTGDLSVQLSVQRDDEIGTLATNINAMGNSLERFVGSLEAQRNRLEIILNSITESIIAIDKEGKIVTANRAAADLAKMPLRIVVGKNINDVFAWTQEGKPAAVSYDEIGSKLYANLQYTNSAGELHHVKLIIAHVSGQQEQKAAQTIVTVHDETKSRELEDMKVDFVSMAAHELRTPLAAVRGYLELITFKASQNSAEETASYLKQALKSAGELGGLINNLLDVTRIERGTLTLNLEKVDLAASVAEATKDASFSAQDKKITLTYVGPAKDRFVYADQIALHEVINNLISNAVKYTPDGGTVTVSLTQAKKQHVVSIADTGVGIPASAHANLFTKFYRVHGGLNSGSTGTGLGLFISKSIIERHGGTINFTSEEGVGSTFSFRLPVFDKEQADALQAAEQPQITEGRRQHGWVTKNITR